MGKETPMGVPVPLKKALEKVIEVSDSGAGSEAERLARWLRPLLEAAVEELATTTITRRSNRGTGEIGYSVEKTQQGEVLTELRHGGKSKPFRCPKKVYEGLAAVLGEADRPLLLDEIMSALETQIGDRPADHQVRVALRLWMHVQPPLVTRSRARHRADSQDEFLGRVTQLWQQLTR